MDTFQVRTIEELQACVREHAEAARARKAPQVRQSESGIALPSQSAQSAPLRAVAGRSKSALSGAGLDAACVVLDVSALSGVIEYQPDECTFTARAATPVADVEAMLAARGQYLPFDPPFAARGATLGGTVASALSGPGRFRYGGVRDFLLGVRFVDGEGRAIRGGGRVVKNAAGFYLQHLLLGSLGTLGVLTEVTFKVFPLPQTRTTIVADHETLAAAIDTLARVRRSTFELEAAELVPPSRLLLRLGGSATALPARANNLSTWLRESAKVTPIADAGEERQCWQDARELTWAPPNMPLVKVATTLGRVAALDQRLGEAGEAAAGSNAGAGPLRRYGAGGDVAWIAWPHALSRLDALLTDVQMPGLVVISGDDIADARAPGAARTDSPRQTSAAQALRSDPLLGPRPDAAFLARVRQTLDPRGVFSARLD